MTKRTPGADRLHAARHAAAKELRLPITDWRVKRLAVLTCSYEQAEASLAAGRGVDVDDLMKLDAALAQARASVPVQHAVTIEIVEGPIEHCPACGWHRGQQVLEATPTSPPADAKPSSSPSAAARPEHSTPGPTPNVVRLKSPRSIHDGAPLKSV
jgi:hypothetical protein